MVIASMQEIHLLEGAFNFVLWKLRLQNLLEIAGHRLMFPCGEAGCIAYKSQRSGITQQEESKSQANSFGFGEGSLDPLFCMGVLL